MHDKEIKSLTRLKKELMTESNDSNAHIFSLPSLNVNHKTRIESIENTNKRYPGSHSKYSSISKDSKFKLKNRDSVEVAR